MPTIAQVHAGMTAIHKKKALKAPFSFFLPFHSHSLHWHRHASCTTATTRELVALEGDDTLLDIVQVDFVVGHICSRDDAETGFVQGFQSVLVTTVADELARFEAEEVAAAVPLLTGSPVVVAVATIDGL